MSYQPSSFLGHKRKRSLASDLEIEDPDFHHDSPSHEEHALAETTLPNQPWTFLACPDRSCDSDKSAHLDTLVIATKGACQCNGRPWADGAVGVFFHPKAEGYNQSLRLPTEMVHTTHRAELYAGILALRIAVDIRARNNPAAGGRKRMVYPAGPLRRLRRVIVKTDSAYMAQDMSEWIENWRLYGFTNQMRSNLGNSDLFQQLEDEVLRLSALGVQVQFAWVPAEENRGAARLARSALEDLAASEAIARFAECYSDQDSDDSAMMY